MVSPEKKQKFSELLKYIRSNDGVKQFAARLQIKLPTYSAWETARAFPSDEIWKNLLPKLCQLSGFTPELIDQYLRGDYELSDLIEGSAKADLPPRSRPIITRAKFRAWLQTLSLSESIQILQDVAERTAQLATNLSVQPPNEVSSSSLQTPEKFPQLPEETLMNEEAFFRSILLFIESLPLEKKVQIDNRLRELIFLRLQELGLLQMRKYQNHPFYILMEGYRIANHLTYEEFEQRLLAEGEEAGLNAQRVSQIVQGEALPDDHELIWIGVFIRRPDGRLYDHDELIALRDGTVQPAFTKMVPEYDLEQPNHHFEDDESAKSGNGNCKVT